MDMRQEIAKQVERLSPSMQTEVLRFVSALTASRPVGEKGSNLLAYSGLLDVDLAREMSATIERSWERVEPI